VNLNPAGALFFIIAAIALMSAPRRWAPIPLLAGVIFITHGQALNLGGIKLPVFRLLLVVGLLRVFTKGESVAGGINVIDKLMAALCGWLLVASFFHRAGADAAGPIFITSKIVEIGLCYYLVRVFCQDIDDFVSLMGIIAILLVPIAMEMILEKLTGKNLFSKVFGGVSEAVVVRDDKLRARGPFRHAILAGTVGAALVPIMIGLWRRNPRSAKIGLVVCLIMVITCASSGPGLSLGFGLFAIFLWKFRQYMGLIRWCIPIGYLALELVMEKPAYYIIGRLSMGGSTGWHRSHLIHSSIEYFGDWWAIGTDYTRSWMPTGVTFSDDHTDITNYFLAFGVMGGILAVILLIAMCWVSFKWVGNIMESLPEDDESGDRFMLWCMGASLFSHVATSISVAYYDQSVFFFWFSIATISSLHWMRFEKQEVEVVPQAEPRWN
jgi:predicted tellurium resistance membrane protein TerC